MRHWIVVASKDHIVKGVAGGFIQANHGKQGPLKRLAVNDFVICYSPKRTLKGTEPCQAFTAIGQVADELVYQHKMSEDFIPYRRYVNYYECKETPIGPLKDQLDFIKNKSSWGYQFRFGFFEISEQDFKLIRSKMLK